MQKIPFKECYYGHYGQKNLADDLERRFTEIGIPTLSRRTLRGEILKMKGEVKLRCIAKQSNLQKKK